MKNGNFFFGAITVAVAATLAACGGGDGGGGGFPIIPPIDGGGTPPPSPPPAPPPPPPAPPPAPAENWTPEGTFNYKAGPFYSDDEKFLQEANAQGTQGYRSLFPGPTLQASYYVKDASSATYTYETRPAGGETKLQYFNEMGARGFRSADSDGAFSISNEFLFRKNNSESIVYDYVEQPGTPNTMTLEAFRSRLNDQGALGYIWHSSAIHDTFERATPSNARYEYQVVDAVKAFTGLSSDQVLEKVNALGDQGYRMLSTAVLEQNLVAIVFVKDTSLSARFRYKREPDPSTSDAEAISFLNAQGASGWFPPGSIKSIQTDDGRSVLLSTMGCFSGVLCGGFIAPPAL